MFLYAAFSAADVLEAKSARRCLIHRSLGLLIVLFIQVSKMPLTTEPASVNRQPVQAMGVHELPCIILSFKSHLCFSPPFPYWAEMLTEYALLVWLLLTIYLNISTHCLRCIALNYFRLANIRRNK